MTLAQRFSNGLNAVRATAPSVFIGDDRWMSFHGIQTPSAVNSPLGRVELFKRSPWSYACCTARSGALKFIPLKLYQIHKDGKKEEFRDHSIVTLLQDINPLDDTPSTTREALETNLYIHGRYQFKKVKNLAGVVKELHGLSVADARPIGRRFVEKWEYIFTGSRNERRVEEYPPEDVVYFRYYDPGDKIEGHSPFMNVVEVTSADIAINITQNAMSRNAARPSAIMTMLNKMNDSDFERENARIQKQYAGAVNAGKIILIDNANDTKFQTIQLSPADMQWIEEHGAHIKDICAVSRVPPGIAGDFGEASRIANAGAMHRFFAEIFVRPELTFIEDVLNWQLLWAEDWGRGLGWERENHLVLQHDITGVSMFREDENAQSERANVAIAAGATFDEARAMQNLPPKGGTLGETCFMPSNLVPVNQLLAGGVEGEGVGSSSDYSASIAEHVNQAGSKLSDSREMVDGQFAKSAEMRQYRKWRKKHPEGTGFRFALLDEEERRSLDDEIRSTLAKVNDALSE